MEFQESATAEMLFNTVEDAQGMENADEDSEEAMNEMWQQQMYDYYNYMESTGETENSDHAMEYYGEDNGEYGDPNSAEYGMMYYSTADDGSYLSTENEAYNGEWQMSGEDYNYYSSEYDDGSYSQPAETEKTDTEKRPEQNKPSVSSDVQPPPADVEAKPKQIKSILKNRIVPVADTKLSLKSSSDTDSADVEIDNYRPYVPPFRTVLEKEGKVDDKLKVQVFDYGHGSTTQTQSKPLAKHDDEPDAYGKSYSKDRDYRIPETYDKHRTYYGEYYRYYDYYYRHGDHRASRSSHYDKYSKEKEKERMRPKDSKDDDEKEKEKLREKEKLKEKDDKEKSKEKDDKEMLKEKDDKEKNLTEKEKQRIKEKEAREEKAMELKRKQKEHREQVSKLFEKLKSAQKAAAPSTAGTATEPKTLTLKDILKVKPATEETDNESATVDSSESLATDAEFAATTASSTTSASTSSTPTVSKKAARAALTLAAKVGIGGTADASVPLFLRKQVVGNDTEDESTTAAAAYGYPMYWPAGAVAGAYWPVYAAGMPRPPWMVAGYPTVLPPGFTGAPAVETVEPKSAGAGDTSKTADDDAPPGLEKKLPSSDALPEAPPGEEKLKPEGDNTAVSKTEVTGEETAVDKVAPFPYSIPPPRPRFGYPMMPFRPGMFPLRHFFPPRLRPPLPAVTLQSSDSAEVEKSESKTQSDSTPVSEEKSTVAPSADASALPAVVAPRPQIPLPPWARVMGWRPPPPGMFRAPFGIMRPGMFPRHPPPSTQSAGQLAAEGESSKQTKSAADTTAELGEGDMEIDDVPAETVIEVAPVVSKPTTSVSSDGSASDFSSANLASHPSIDYQRYRRPPPFPPHRMLRPPGLPPHFLRPPPPFAGRLPVIANQFNDNHVTPPVSSEQLSLPPPVSDSNASALNPASQASSEAVPDATVSIAAKPVMYSSSNRPPPPPPRAAAHPRPGVPLQSSSVLSQAATPLHTATTTVPQPVPVPHSSPTQAAPVAAVSPQNDFHQRLPPPEYSRLLPPSVHGQAPLFRRGFPPPLNRPPPSMHAVASPWSRPPPRLPLANTSTSSVAAAVGTSAYSQPPPAGGTTSADGVPTQASVYEHYYKYYYQYYNSYYQRLGYSTGGPAGRDPAALAAATAAATAAAQWAQQSVATAAGGTVTSSPAAAATTPTPAASSTDQSQQDAKKDKDKKKKKKKDKNSEGDESDTKKPKLENVNTPVLSAQNIPMPQATTESVQQQQQQTLTLWVGNLPDGTKAIDIKNMIGDAVKVISCKIGMGKGPKATGLFALIGVESSKELAVCIDKLDKKELNGKILETKKMKVAS